MESFKVAKDDAYGQLPKANSKHVYRLSDDYMATATKDVALQLSKGGVRLAFVLNQTLGREVGNFPSLNVCMGRKVAFLPVDTGLIDEF